MSDLTATSCGCGNSPSNDCGCGNLLWIILLLCMCGGNGGNGCGGNMGGLCGGNDNGCGGNLLWILILLCCCNNG